jgi:hypothetical protein
MLEHLPTSAPADETIESLGELGELPPDPTNVVRIDLSDGALTSRAASR